MREFFKPWRRKTGVVTLLLALALLAAWVRSLSILDEFGIEGDRSYHRIVSTCGGIVCITDQPKPTKGMHQGRRWAYLNEKFKRYPTLDGWEMDRPLEQHGRRFAWAGFAYGTSHSSGQMLTAWITPYSSIVLPLTLLSAYLLLAKRRAKSADSQPDHPITG